MSEKKNGSYKSRKQLYLASFIVCVATAGLSATSVYASNDLAVESTSISSYEETEASSVSNEEQEISKNEISEGYYEESMLKTERHEFEKNTSTINPLTEQLLANGIFGECYWRVYSIDTEIILELSAGQLANFGSSIQNVPWHSYRSSITKIVILDGVKAPERANFLFAEFSQLVEIDGIEKLDVTNAKSLNFLFYNSRKLKNLNLNDWNVEFVESMESIFMNTTGLNSLDVSGWDTRSLENADSMFFNTGIQFLDLNQWNTSSVKSMRFMFATARNLTNLYIDKWNTDSVTTMEGMFFYCSGLSELDLDQWDTSSLLNIAFMFQNSSGLSDLKISGWSVDKVQQMDLMFMNMDNLKELNLSNWNTEGVKTMSQMFANTNLMSLTLGEKFRFLNNASLPEITTEGYTGQWMGENTATIFTSSSDFMNHYEGQADTYVWESKVMKITFPVRMLFYSEQDDITRLTSNMYQFSNSGNMTTKIEIVDLEDMLNIEEIQQLYFGDVELIRNGESVRTMNALDTLEILSPETTITKKFYGNAQPLTDEINPKFDLIFRFSFANEVE